MARLSAVILSGGGPMAALVKDDDLEPVANPRRDGHEAAVTATVSVEDDGHGASALTVDACPIEPTKDDFLP